MPTPASTVSFADGTTAGAPCSGVANSTAPACDGTQGPAITASGSNHPWIWVIRSPAGLGDNGTVTAPVRAPAGANLGAQLFVSDAGYAHLTAGGWTTGASSFATIPHPDTRWLLASASHILGRTLTSLHRAHQPCASPHASERLQGLLSER